MTLLASCDRLLASDARKSNDFRQKRRHVHLPKGEFPSFAGRKQSNRHAMTCTKWPNCSAPSARKHAWLRPSNYFKACAPFEIVQCVGSPLRYALAH